MNYFEAVLWLVSWPILIIISFQLIKYFLKKMKYIN